MRSVQGHNLWPAAGIWLFSLGNCQIDYCSSCCKIKLYFFLNSLSFYFAVKFFKVNFPPSSLWSALVYIAIRNLIYTFEIAEFWQMHKCYFEESIIRLLSDHQEEVTGVYFGCPWSWGNNQKRISVVVRYSSWFRSSHKFTSPSPPVCFPEDITRFAPSSQKKKIYNIYLR